MSNLFYKFFVAHRATLLFGFTLAVLLLLLRVLEWKFLLLQHSFELYAGCIALIFLLLGIWLPRSFRKKNKVAQQHPTFQTSTISPALTPNNDFSLNSREMEVLQLIAAGKSNQEIADALFISPNTVKTHCSKLFDKLQVKRRTQAVALGKNLGLIK